jgi:hypothetical protein
MIPELENSRTQEVKNSRIQEVPEGRSKELRGVDHAFLSPEFLQP